MPPLEEVDCWDTAVLWAATGGYDNQGQPQVADPIQLDYPNGVRWIGKQAWVIAPDGNTLLVDATAVVNQDIPIHSRMWKGKLSDWFGSGSAEDYDQQLMVVKSFNSTDDSKGRFARKTVGMLRYKNK